MMVRFRIYGSLSTTFEKVKIGSRRLGEYFDFCPTSYFSETILPAVSRFYGICTTGSRHNPSSSTENTSKKETTVYTGTMKA
jgi:hypothetical protein